MPSFEVPASVRMNRIAVVAPQWAVRDVLVDLAESGAVEIVGDPAPASGPATEALTRLERTGTKATVPRVQRRVPDVSRLEADGAADLLAGEAELERRRGMAVEHGRIAAFVGWTPDAALPALAGRLAEVGASVVKLQPPSGEDPPTLLQPRRVTGSFRPLLNAYGVLPYSDIDPTGFAAVAFVLMFGMMFGDVGHGAILVAIGLFFARAVKAKYRPMRPAAPLLVACGISGMTFGLLYGEFFGPTGIIEPLWLNPLEEPLVLFAAAVIFGAALLAISYLLGTVNRWRETGPGTALYASSGLAGTSVFIAIAAVVVGLLTGVTGWYLLALVLAGIGLALLFVGAYSEAGGGSIGTTLAVVNVFETTLRIVSSGVSFVRLAAFGMMHAALSLVIWTGTVALAEYAWGWPFAIALFVVGTALAIALEALVAGIQALRLEYYEMFSRVFSGEGRVFLPFEVELVKDEELV
jgi:V/A-type H+-transporting ATPase subunit I